MDQLTRRIAAALGALATLTSQAFAHHPGGIGNSGGAGPINTISASTLEQGQTVAGVIVDTTRLDTLRDTTLANAALAGNDGVHGLRSVASYSAVLARGITDDLMLGVRLPFVRRTGIKAGERDDDGTVNVLDHGSSNGFGDVTMLGQYRFLNDKKNQLEAAILAGFTAPTGPSDRRSRQGELLDAEFQPGTGAWTGLLGAAVTKRFGAWSFDTNVLYFRTSEGTQSTNLGDQLLYNAAISYRLSGLTGFTTNAKTGPMFHGAVPHKHGDDGHAHTHDEPKVETGPKLDLVLEMNGEWHDRQQTLGIKDLNSGGNTIYVAPGLRLSQDKWSAFVSVGKAVVNDSNGIQSESDIRVRTGLAVAF